MAEVEEPPNEDNDDAEAGEEKPYKKFTINRVLIKPGKSLAVSKDENISTRLPILRQATKPYSPMPYIFRVPTTSTPTKVVNLLARSPPFYVLLDHTIAVLWLVFGAGEYDCPLGINQLQWALEFLKTVQDRNGNYPKDVEVAIEAIENILINDYSELNKDIDPAMRLDETVHYGGGALASSTMVTAEIPFSLNYSNMITKLPPSVYVPGAKQPISMTSLECEEAIEELKKAAGVDSIDNLDSVSKDKAINVLRMWKSDQVEKIRGELRRLRSIEDKMRDIDANFPGYMEDEPAILIRTD